MLVIDQAQNNRAVKVAPGQSFQVQLPENPTTGFRWRSQSTIPSPLRVVEDVFEPSASGVGAGGARHWTFVADTIATIGLQFELRRGGQQEPAKTFSVTVEVTLGKASV